MAGLPIYNGKSATLMQVHSAFTFRTIERNRFENSRKEMASCKKLFSLAPNIPPYSIPLRMGYLSP